MPGPGISLSADSPYNATKPVINMEREAYLRQHFGMEVPGVVTGRNDTVMRYTYGTGAGVISVGSPQMHSATRPFSDDMHVVRNYLTQFLLDISDGSMPVPNLVHLTVIAYFQRRKVKPSTCQLHYHRDVTYSQKGNYSVKKNSQRENTPTIILCVGEPRVLRFRLCTIMPSQRVQYGSVVKEFTLEHGDIFVLHPDDERPMVRPEIDSNHMTYFQHGDIRHKSDGVSIGLAFRETIHYMPVRADSGIPAMCVQSHINQLFTFQKNYWIMQRYIKDKHRKEDNDKNMHERYERTKQIFF